MSNNNEILPADGEFYGESQIHERENWLARNRFPVELCADHLRFVFLKPAPGEDMLQWRIEGLSARIVTGIITGSYTSTITLVHISARIPKKILRAGREAVEEQSWLESIPRLQVERRLEVMGSGSRHIPMPDFLKQLRPVNWTEADYTRLLEEYADGITFEQSLLDRDIKARLETQARDGEIIAAAANPSAALGAAIAQGLAAALAKMNLKPAKP
jgi:hypothetical protein